MSKPKRIRRMIKSAKMGKPYAMYQLGLELHESKFLKEDTYAGVEWIRAAAELGYAPAVEWMEDYVFDDDARVQAEA